MSVWHLQKEAFVWTEIGGEAYLLTRFNQSRGGVYVISSCAGYKFSLHTDGNSHGRFTDKSEKHEDFTLPPIKNISTHCMVSLWLPIHPDIIRNSGRRIESPPADSNSIFIGAAEDLFEPYCNLVIEAHIYDVERSPEIQAHFHSNMPHREHMEPKIFKEYELEDHGKVLGVAIYIARFESEAAA